MMLKIPTSAFYGVKRSNVARRRHIYTINNRKRQRLRPPLAFTATYRLREPVTSDTTLCRHSGHAFAASRVTMLACARDGEGSRYATQRAALRR